jgi:NADH-quinone oxidoreductase subunit L
MAVQMRQLPGFLAAGIFLAWWIYQKKKIDPAKITGRLGEVYVTVKNKYYIDEFANATVIKGTMALARFQKWIDENLVDGSVRLVGHVSMALATICSWIDKHIVDGLVNWLALTTQSFGSVIRLFQTGRIQQYASLAVGGVILAAAFMILS